jgi:RNA polymerase sigma-70 factor (ECF subfamily)
MKFSSAKGIPRRGVENVEETQVELLARCADGDETAFRELHRQCYPFVWRLARRLGTPESELDDVVQDVFLVAFQKSRQFQQGDVHSWLYRIVANVVGGRHRRRRVREALFFFWGPGAAKSSEQTPETQYAAHENERAVARILERMSPKKREVFVLFEMEGLGGERVAELVGCKLPTVWTRLFHARKEFRELAVELGVVTPDAAE